MPISVWSYLEEYTQEKEEVWAAIEKVLQSGRLILGESVKNFEQAFAQWCQAAYGTGVANGTDALFLALKALGVEAGDEVITVSNTAVPTVSAIVSAGAIPRFVDIDPQTYLMDTQQLEAAIGEKTRCLLPVHLYGQCVEMSFLNEIAEKYHLKILEDCAQSHGARQKGKVAGSFGHAAAFSFYPTKILGGYGDGGMVLTQDSSIDEKLKRLRFYGMKDRYYAQEDGYNSRLDELHAAILLKKLDHLDNYIKRRQQIAQYYYKNLSNTPLILPTVASDNQPAWYLFVVRHPQRDVIIEELKKQNIFVNVSYPWPIHTMPPYQKYLRPQESLSETEKAAREIFSLPMYPSLKDEEVETVCQTLQEICKKID